MKCKKSIAIITGLLMVLPVFAKTDTMKQVENTLIQKVTYLNKLYQNGFRVIDEYDNSNDEGTDVALWSRARTMEEAQRVLLSVLDERETLLKSVSAEKYAYQASVQGWDFGVDKKKSLYENVLLILRDFTRLGDARFRDMMLSETAWLLKYRRYATAYFALSLTNDLEQNPEVKRTRWEKYLPDFGPSDEATAIRVNIFECETTQSLNALERNLFDDIDNTELQEHWRNTVLKLRKETEQLTTEVDKMRDKSLQLRSVRMLRTLLDNKMTSIEVKELDVSANRVKLEIKALVRSEGMKLLRKKGLRNRKSEPTESEVMRFDGPRVVHVEVTDKLNGIDFYRYLLYNPELKCENAKEQFEFTRIIVEDYPVAKKGVLLHACSRADGSGYAGLTWQREDRDGKVIANGVTDEQGFAFFPLGSAPSWIRYHDKGLCRGGSVYVPEKQKNDGLSIRRDAVVFFMDRPLYRRGQVVKAGALFYRQEHDKIDPVTVKNALLKFYAYKGAKKVEISTQKLTSNVNGIAPFELTIPEDQDLDNYQIAIGQYGSEVVRVEEYKRQYLTVTPTLIPGGYVPGFPLIIEGKTTDLNGLPVSAKVTLTYDDGQEKIETASGSDGRFVIETPVVHAATTSSYWWNGEMLTLRSSDALGNVATYSWAFNKLDTDFPLSADAAIKGENLDKEDFIIDLSSQPYLMRLLGDLSDRKVSARLLPDDKQEKTVELGQIPVESQQHFSLSVLKSGFYRLELYAVDGYGKEVNSVSRRLYFFGLNDIALEGQHLLWLVSLQEETLYGSSQEGVATLLLFNRGKWKAIALPLQPQCIAHLPKASYDGAERALIKVVHGLRSETRYLKGDESDEEPDSANLSVEGLNFKEGETFLPGGRFHREIWLKDKEGKPLSGQPVIVTVYDKAVADAAGYEDFWNIVRQRYYDAFDYSCEGVYEEVMKVEEKAFAPAPMMRAMSADMGVLHENTTGSNASGIQIRRNFVETAFFSALLVTDKEGKVTLDFTLPDNETTYNIKLYTHTEGFEDERISDSHFKVYAPLSVDVSLPRFMLWGDTLHGEMQLRNASDQVMETMYDLSLPDGSVLTSGKTVVAANGTAYVPFTLTVDAAWGDTVTVVAHAVSGEVKVGVERILPLHTNLATYIVASPISAYRQQEVTIDLPKGELNDGEALLELYLDPTMVLLTQLAHDYGTEGVGRGELFTTLYQYYVYSRLNLYLQKHPETVRQLRERAEKLEKAGAVEKSVITDRQADPATLSVFFRFITDGKQLGEQLVKMEKQIYAHRAPGGGFYYDRIWQKSSPFLTSYVLRMLAPTWTDIAYEPLKKYLKGSMSYLASQIEDSRSYYRDYLEFAMLSRYYGTGMELLSKTGTAAYKKQVDAARDSYRHAGTWGMLRFAEYSRLYDTEKDKADVLQFIIDRMQYTRNDEELLNLTLFMNKDKAEVAPNVIAFVLKMKQGTLWSNVLLTEVVDVLLDKIEPTQLSSSASITIDGREAHRLTPMELSTGVVTLKGVKTKRKKMTVRWNGVESDFVFGGIRYLVTEPSASTTPTGEKLKVRKQIFVRQVSETGVQTFAEVTPEHPAKKGDRLIIRYTIDAEQDLSLVTLVDPRPACAEMGYDLSGFHRSDRLWWSYSRRDTEDRIYIDYLTRGQHTLQLEATANVGGSFTYGPAQVQSYYAPEYAGNSAGGQIEVAMDKSK